MIKESWLPGLALLASFVASCESSPALLDDAGPGGDARRDTLDASDASDGLDAARRCATHYDCEQKGFCYRGRCVLDPDYPVYHCGKKDEQGDDTCPPGQRCLEPSGTEGTCDESKTYRCADACDCGPAHCCKKAAGAARGHCVKDTDDPWRPGGVVVGDLGTCQRGTDPTYCCADPGCHAGRHAYGLGADRFRCGDEQGQTRSFCGGTTCSATACNCPAGQTCVDTAAATPLPGKACGLFVGGSCVPHAAAEAVFGYRPADLLPCCTDRCVDGERCEVGWRSDGEYAYVRVVGVCGGACGNGSCDPGESLESCPADCRFPLEGTPRCGAPGELNAVWSEETLCGDGVCQGSSICDWQQAESCRTCPQDCGECAWTLVAGLTGALADLNGVWIASATEALAVGDRGTVLRFDGASWRPMRSGVATNLNLHAVWSSGPDEAIAVGEAGLVLRYGGGGWATISGITPVALYGVWGSSAKDVFAVGYGGTIVRFDGTAWASMPSKTTQALHAVWGTSPGDVYAVGGREGASPSAVVARYDGASWEPIFSAAGPPLRGVWASSPDNVVAVGGDTILRYDGASWSKTIVSGARLSAVWGSSATSVFAAGEGGTLLRFDGTAWKPMASGTTLHLMAIGGRSATDVFAVGETGTLRRFDGASWSGTGAAAALRAAWTDPGGDHGLYVVGDHGTILHHDGISWRAMPSPVTTDLTALWGSSPTNIVAVGEGATILRYDGAGWKPSVSPATFDGTDLYGVWGSSADDVLAVGFDRLAASATILRFDGAAWKHLRHGPLVGYRAIWGSSAGDVYVAGNVAPRAGAIERFDGASWQTVFKASRAVSSLWGSSASDVYAVASGQIYRGAGAQWTPTDAPKVADGLWGHSASDVFAFGDRMLRYDGAQWAEVRSLDLRDPISRSCVALKAMGGTPGKEVVVGEQGVILHRCPGDTCASSSSP